MKVDSATRIYDFLVISPKIKMMKRGGGFLFPSAISSLYLICNEQLGLGSWWSGAGRF
jgi:hypothetical protein